MALPKIDVPTFELTQPSTKEKLTYRPFRVKEEKILLIAKESGNKDEIFNAVKQVVNNCIINEKFNVDKIPIFDLEYIFIKLRSSSIGNVCKFTVTDSSDNIEYTLEVDLNDVEITFESDYDPKVMLDGNDKFGIMMKCPETNIMEKVKDLKTLTDVAYEMVKNSIDYIFDENDTYDWSSSSQQEQEEFLDTLSPQDYIKLQEFFIKVPKIEHVVTYENSNGDEKRVVFRSLDDFFDLG